MTKAQLYEEIDVVKGYHWCGICDDEADFVIVNNAVYGVGKELPLCKKCAEMLKNKINIGLSI